MFNVVTLLIILYCNQYNHFYIIIIDFLSYYRLMNIKAFKNIFVTLSSLCKSTCFICSSF